jgi:hypothetical protein
LIPVDPPAGHALSNDQPVKSQDILPAPVTIARVLFFEKIVTAPAGMLPFGEDAMLSISI